MSIDNGKTGAPYPKGIGSNPGIFNHVSGLFIFSNTLEKILDIEKVTKAKQLRPIIEA